MRRPVILSPASAALRFGLTGLSGSECVLFDRLHADLGAWVSGAALGAVLGLPPLTPGAPTPVLLTSAVWRLRRRLRGTGWQIASRRGVGYRLTGATLTLTPAARGGPTPYPVAPTRLSPAVRYGLVHLTPVEAHLFDRLFADLGHYVPRVAINTALMGDPDACTENYARIAVGRLRQRLRGTGWDIEAWARVAPPGASRRPGGYRLVPPRAVALTATNPPPTE